MSVIHSPAAAFGFPVQREVLYAAAAKALKAGGVGKASCMGYDDPLEFLTNEIPPSELLEVLGDLGVDVPFTLVAMGSYYAPDFITLYVSSRGWSVESMYEGVVYPRPIPTENDVAALSEAGEFLGLGQLPPINFYIGTLIH